MLRFKQDGYLHFAHSPRGMWMIEQRRGQFIVTLSLQGAARGGEDQEMGSYPSLKKAVSEASRADRELAKQDFADIAKDPATMTAGEINKELDKLSKVSSAINDEFLAAGRGHERPSETRYLEDPLSLRWRETSDRLQALHMEIESRYGPGAPSRMPKGFKPRKKLEGAMAGHREKPETDQIIFTDHGDIEGEVLAGQAYANEEEKFWKHSYVVGFDNHVNIGILVNADHDGDAVDAAADFAEEMGYEGYFLDEKEIEDDEDVLRVGNHGRPVNGGELWVVEVDYDPDDPSRFTDEEPRPYSPKKARKSYKSSGPSGYHDCDCCGETIVGARLCDGCKKAGCEKNKEGVYDDCQIPMCPECETRASLMNDGKWHSNCEDGCPNEGKVWKT